MSQIMRERLSLSCREWLARHVICGVRGFIRYTADGLINRMDPESVPAATRPIKRQLKLLNPFAEILI